MTIEFRCTQCDKLLRTPDGTEGKKAKCPECGTVLTIPVPVTEGEPIALAPEQAPPPPRQPSDNPYQSPAATEMRAESSPGELRRGFQPTLIDLGEVMGRAWQIYKRNFWPCVGTALLGTILSNAVGQGAGYVARQNGPLEGAALNLFAGVVSIFLSIGVFTYMLKIARGEPASVADLFGGGALLLPAIGISILYGLAALVGFILLIIPGIIVLLMFSQAIFILIDQQTGVIDSLRLSAQVTKGNKLTLFAIWCVSLGLSILGLLACFVGVFFVSAYLMLLLAVSYLMMTGQSTAADPRAE